MARIDLSAQGEAGDNVCAFLDMLAFAEGTILYGGDDGYNVLVGGKTFDSYEKHPKVYVKLSFRPRVPSLSTTPEPITLTSSAAGRYQFLWRTWQALALKLSLPDFGPVSQDKAAIELIRERKALKDVRDGNIILAIQKCRPIWASLPGAGYGQREHKLADLLREYSKAGGM